jgi:hypothetical protein
MVNKDDNNGDRNRNRTVPAKSEKNVGASRKDTNPRSREGILLSRISMARNVATPMKSGDNQ